MKIRTFLLTIFFLAVAPAGSQELQPGQDDSRPPSGQQSPSEKPAPKRPTLGPSGPPTLLGPKTSNTTDARRLVRVKKIYVERMDNGLDEKLIELLAKTRRVRLVGDYKEADAILRGTCFDSRRLKILRSEVYLNEVKGASIWQDSVRRPINPPKIDVAVTEAAELITAHLTESMNEAERQ